MNEQQIDPKKAAQTEDDERQWCESCEEYFDHEPYKQIGADLFCTYDCFIEYENDSNQCLIDPAYECDFEDFMPEYDHQWYSEDLYPCF